MKKSPVTKVVSCPKINTHTKRPEDYVGFHEWAMKKSKTHKQIRCKDCGLWAKWIKK
jgi:hypothetical protein